jgi:hypothetical protein
VGVDLQGPQVPKVEHDPPSAWLWPARLWPPPRTASSRPVSRAIETTWATSLGSVGRTMTAGRRPGAGRDPAQGLRDPVGVAVCVVCGGLPGRRLPAHRRRPARRQGRPETIAEHPRLFVTFTAPSFGLVHSRRAQGRLVLPCHPYRQGRTCPHGRRAGCWSRHDADDQVLGEPICSDCYDARGQVLWNALAPVLWRYTTTYVDRALARHLGLSEAQLRKLVRVSYVKVAEFQRRGAVHFHAIVRLDAATACRCPACLTPHPPGSPPATSSGPSARP